MASCHYGSEHARHFEVQDSKSATQPQPVRICDWYCVINTHQSRFYQSQCADAGCKTTKANIRQMFPGLHVLPRPEPESSSGSLKDAHDAWAVEYQQWGALKCPCGRGYFYRLHGSWISGEEVGSGAAATCEMQRPGSCPGYHSGRSGMWDESNIVQRHGIFNRASDAIKSSRLRKGTSNSCHQFFDPSPGYGQNNTVKAPLQSSSASSLNVGEWSECADMTGSTPARAIGVLRFREGPK
ncbi:hypothetical protein C8J57DRAFT_1587913 [Mycena rebaudengoi]|nr:hypothetical protein C8J57DRAFT_1587913 [Mycena rebaudengoi]